MKARLPRGVSNANPGNLRKTGDPWQGLAPQQTDPEFFTFIDPTYGIRALARTLISYQDKHNLRTIRDIIRRWAPATENDTQAYIAHVVRRTGWSDSDRLDLHDYDTLLALSSAIIRHECGAGPLPTSNSWYDDTVMHRAMVLAGVEPPKREAGGVPITTETAGAVGALAVAFTQFIDSLKGLDGHALIGVALIVVAVAIIYKQRKRRKDGTV